MIKNVVVNKYENANSKPFSAIIEKDNVIYSVDFGEYEELRHNLCNFSNCDVLHRNEYLTNNIIKLKDLNFENIINSELLNIYLLHNKRNIHENITDLNRRLEKFYITNKFDVYIENTPMFFYKDLVNIQQLNINM